MTAAGVRVDGRRAARGVDGARGDGEDGALDLRFEACSAPAALDADAPVARAGGMEGYEQLCRVDGIGDATAAGRTRCAASASAASCGARRTGIAIELARTLSAWLGDDRALTLTAVRPGEGQGPPRRGGQRLHVRGAARRCEIADPRLSTTYDGERRQRRAGLELWMTEEGDLARRVAGEVLCGTTLDLGDLRLDSAFFAWRMEGREGVGRYDVLRRAGGGGRKRRGIRAQLSSVVRAEPVPEVELDALRRELAAALARQVRQHGLQRLLLGDARVERLLAAEAGGDLQRLAPVVAERSGRR